MTTTTRISENINRYRAQAATAKNEFAKARDLISSDTTRTSEWRREQSDAARRTLANTLDKLRLDELAYLENKTTELERSVFGIQPGQDILAYRDAQDRVRKIVWANEADALALYRQAERSDDHTLQQALSERAVDAGWKEVQTRHTTNHPEQGDKIEALDAIQSFMASEHAGINAAMDYTMPFN